MPTPFFRVEMLPAKHGDALWIEYGSGSGPTRRIVIDGGPINAYPEFEAKLRQLPDGDKRVELLVITHVDTDHIEGTIRLLALPRQRWPFAPRDIWFNGYRHLRPQTDLGGREGEFLSALIHQRAFAEWNKAFNREAVVITNAADLPRITLDGGMALTLLSPDTRKLSTLAEKWEEDLAGSVIRPGDLERAWAELVKAKKFTAGAELTLGPEDLTAKLRAQLKGRDASAANGSSIAFLAEFDDKRCLFLADAHMNLVCESLEKLIPPGATQLRVDAIKLSHHGSKHNITPRLLELVDARHFLVSTNGDRHDHPDPDAMEAVVLGSTRRPTLWFNYRSAFTEPWERRAAAPGARFDARFPERGAEGIAIALHDA
jgi:beta-lactamase superfamily II metal-dependent hydrolase